MSGSICLLIRNAPYGKIQAAEAIRHINGAISNGLETAVVLVNDGVYFAKDDQKAKEAGWTSLSDVVKQTQEGKHGGLVKFYIHDESALSRVIDQEKAIPGFKAISSSDLADIVSGAKRVLLF